MGLVDCLYIPCGLKSHKGLIKHMSRNVSELRVVIARNPLGVYCWKVRENELNDHKPSHANQSHAVSLITIVDVRITELPSKFNYRENNNNNTTYLRRTCFVWSTKRRYMYHTVYTYVFNFTYCYWLGTNPSSSVYICGQGFIDNHTSKL